MVSIMFLLVNEMRPAELVREGKSITENGPSCGIVMLMYQIVDGQLRHSMCHYYPKARS